MNIVRKIRLNKLGCYEFKDYEKDLFIFINKNILNLKKFTLEEYPSFIFYFNSKNKSVFQHNLNNNSFYINRDIWNVLYDKYNYKDFEIKKNVKEIFMDSYKIKEDIQPCLGECLFIENVHKAYKLKNSNIFSLSYLVNKMNVKKWI